MLCALWKPKIGLSFAVTSTWKIQLDSSISVQQDCSNTIELALTYVDTCEAVFYDSLIIIYHLYIRNM